ncbi:MAG: response regulator, partial [Candidatus Cloacimonetes bacterium]|nr:response regulator [Candidatus Cloacimonadota bacterium]
AKNGREALNILQEQDIDLVISDILMPVMDGFALCREIRRHQKYRHIPFIVYTATYKGDQDELLARKIGADEFIIKPCEPEEFMERVNRAIAKRKINMESEPPEIQNDETVLKLYNERLVRKLEDKMLEMENEVSERKKAIDALQRSQELLQATQTLSKLGGWEYDLDTQETYWTDEMYRLHDLDKDCAPEELAYLSMAGYPDESKALLKQYIEDLATNGNPYNLETWYTTKRGRKIFIRASAEAKWEDGRIRRIMGTFQDITESKEAEIRQHELMEQLRQAQKLDSIGQLAGGVAHDFNNVLTVILGYSEEIMNNLHDQDPLRQDIQEIINAGQRASSLTRQLLTFSRKQVIKPELINLNDTITNLSKMLMRLIGEDVDFILNLGDDVPSIMADIGQIEQVIMNLVINAREAMQMGGRLTISTFKYEAEPEFRKHHRMIAGNTFAVLKVEDTGCGMDKSTLEHIYEPFFTTKAKGHGTGLGLPTVYGIVRQASGHINVDSAPGKGATFVIMLPATNDELQTEQKPEVQIIPEGNKELVLIVEDDPSISDLSGKMIQKMGYRVMLAESADKAIVMIEDEGLRPELVISDVVMPGLSGLELAAIIRYKHPDMKVILMSGYTEQVIMKHGEMDPNIPFLHKPFTRQELQDRITQVMQKR